MKKLQNNEILNKTDNFLDQLGPRRFFWIMACVGILFAIVVTITIAYDSVNKENTSTKDMKENWIEFASGKIKYYSGEIKEINLQLDKLKNKKTKYKQYINILSNCKKTNKVNDAFMQDCKLALSGAKLNLTGKNLNLK